MPMHFCPRCGAALILADDHGTMRPRCPACGFVAYQNSKPTAGVLITKGRSVLLVRWAIAPYKDHWDIVGGFLELGEHPEDGARREAREETNLTIELVTMLPIRIDRYGAEDWTLNIYYVARAVAGTERAGDDAAALGWFDADALPEAIAFPDHQRAVLDDWRRWLDTHMPID